MLEVYQATNIQLPALQGGTTKPCVMSAVDSNSNNVGSFVVKIFTQQQEKQQQATLKEVCASWLASKLGVKMPYVALVKVDDVIITQIKTESQRSDIKAGVYFATKYHPNIQTYTQTLFEELTDIDDRVNIFAFDMLIQNRDRRIAKPNVFFEERNIYLIDHELSLEVAAWNKGNPTPAEILKNVAYLSEERRHICYDCLATEYFQKRIPTFDEIEDNLRNLRISELQDIVNQLELLGVNIEAWQEIKPYLTSIINQTTTFINPLKQIFS